MNNTFYKKAESFMEESGISEKLKNASAILVAYSGGADSSVLLRFLSHYVKNKNIPLAAAHLNHMIRGDEAERDKEFCKKTATEMGVDFYSADIDIPRLAKEQKIGTEECARNERYNFLRSVAAMLGENTLIATAHNATDNMETVIFNLVRGTGTAGLCGIAPVRDDLIRPLLSHTSEEIRSFAEENKIPFVFDSTNDETLYTRNYVRHNIIPAAKHINPQAEDAILRLNKIARSETAFISDEAKKLTENGYINKDAYANCHESLKRRAISQLYTEAAGKADGLSMKHIDAAVKLCDEGNGKISFPAVTLFSDTDRIYFSKGEENEDLPEIILSDDGIAVPFGESFAVCMCKKGKTPEFDENIYNLFIKQSIRFGTIYGSVLVRCRREGDLIFSGKKHKKLKKLLCDHKIPLRIRNSLPVFCDDNGILWVPSVALRDNTADKNGDVTLYLFTLKENSYNE